MPHVRYSSTSWRLRCQTSGGVPQKEEAEKIDRKANKKNALRKGGE